MGGFASSVQAPQTSGQSSGKGGPVGQAVEQVTDQASAANSPQPIPQQSSGKGGSIQQFPTQVSAPSYMSDDFGSGRASNTSFRDAIKPMGKGGVQTNSATSGQPRVGMQNQYSNTVGQWDNTQIQPVQRNGKGKGA
jgi:hypothetical protein